MELKHHVTKIEWNNRPENDFIVGKMTGFIDGVAMIREENIKKRLSVIEDPETNEVRSTFIIMDCSDEFYELFKKFVKDRYSYLDTITFDYKR